MTAAKEREARTRPWTAGQIAVMLFAAVSLADISAELAEIKDAIRADTTSRMCIKIWELGGDTPTCDRLMGKEPKP